MKLLKKLLPVMLMTLLAWNCEKEDVIPEKIATEKEFSIEEVNFEQLSNKELVSEVFQKIKNSPKGSPTEKAKLSNFTIDSSKVKKLIRNGKTTYIFLVKRDSLDLERFENLVVFKDSNNTTKAFLLEYLTEHVELAEPHSSFSYDGKPKITPLSETENIGAAAKQLQICYSVTVTYCTWGGTHIAGAACLAANDDRTYTVNQTNCIWFDDGSSSGSPGGWGGGGGGGGPDPGDGFDNSPLGDDLTFKVKNFVKYSLSITERQWFYAASDTFRKQMVSFLDAHDFSNYSKDLGSFEIQILSENILSSNKLDYKNSVLRMAAGLRKFGGEEGILFAEYFENMAAEFNGMSVGEVRDFYALAKDVTEQFNKNMRTNIISSYVDGLAMPILEMALLEVGGTLAIKMLQKIPISWVYRGARLNNMAKKVAKLGSPGTSSRIRMIPNSSLTKSQETFNMLTKNAISVTTENLPGGKYRKIANMGNNNYITFRNFDYSNTPNLVGNIDLNFPNIWIKTRELKFIK